MQTNPRESGMTVLNFDKFPVIRCNVTTVDILYTFRSVYALRPVGKGHFFSSLGIVSTPITHWFSLVQIGHFPNCFKAWKNNTDSASELCILKHITKLPQVSSDGWTSQWTCEWCMHSHMYTMTGVMVRVTEGKLIQSKSWNKFRSVFTLLLKPFCDYSADHSYKAIVNDFAKVTWFFLFVCLFFLQDSFYLDVVAVKLYIPLYIACQKWNKYKFCILEIICQSYSDAWVL